MSEYLCVFIRTSTYVFKMDSIPPEVHKNSGLIISTGTGSTAWCFQSCNGILIFKLNDVRIQNEIRIPDVVIRELFTHGWPQWFILLRVNLVLLGKLASIDKDDVQEGIFSLCMWILSVNLICLAVDEYRRTCVFPSTEDRMLFFCRSSITGNPTKQHDNKFSLLNFETGKHVSGYARR